MRPDLSASSSTDRHADVTPRDVASSHAFRLIDVREPHEYTGELGHIEGSELVPLGDIVSAAATWDRLEPLVLICRSGNRSGRAARLLQELGFEEAHNMAGGMLRWNAEGLPVARG